MTGVNDSGRTYASCRRPVATRHERGLSAVRGYARQFALVLAGLYLALAGYACAAESRDWQALHLSATGDYLAVGGDVHLRSDVDGEAIVAGGNVLLDREVKGNIIATGGNITLKGRAHDNVYLAGGTVLLDGAIAGTARVAGGRIIVGEDASINGWAKLYGGQVDVKGYVGSGLSAMAEVVSIGGEVRGNVDVTAREVQVLDTAKIGGSLTYHSPQPAKIDPAAQITGGVNHSADTFRKGVVEARRAAQVFGALLGTAVLLLIGGLFILLFPDFAVAAGRNMLSHPLKSLVLGISVLLIVPLLIVILLLTVIGIPLALAVIPLFPLVVLLGYVVAGVFLGDWLLALVRRRKTAGRVLRFFSVVISLGLLTWVATFEYGSWAILLALVLGLGAFALQLYRTYKGGAPGMTTVTSE